MYQFTNYNIFIRIIIDFVLKWNYTVFDIHKKKTGEKTITSFNKFLSKSKKVFFFSLPFLCVTDVEERFTEIIYELLDYHSLLMSGDKDNRTRL